MVASEHFSVVEYYAHLKAQIKSLEERAREIQPEVLALVRDAGGGLDVNGIKLSVGSRKKWTYPAHIDEMADSLKEAKKDAETDGDATFTESEYLICR